MVFYLEENCMEGEYVGDMVIFVCLYFIEWLW
jgi:hypothetical protein